MKGQPKDIATLAREAAQRVVGRPDQETLDKLADQHLAELEEVTHEDEQRFRSEVCEAVRRANQRRW